MMRYQFFPSRQSLQFYAFRVFPKYHLVSRDHVLFFFSFPKLLDACVATKKTKNDHSNNSC